MHSRRTFLRHSALLGALGLVAGPLVGCASFAGPQLGAAREAPMLSSPLARKANQRVSLKKRPPLPDLFDAANLDRDFWLKPRTLSVIRPMTGEKARVLYWKDGHIQEGAYQQLCHMLRDVNGKATRPMDPKLLEVLWGTQAFVARFGISSPVEILSGYRTLASNNRLKEQGLPAARKSLHLEGRAADLRIRHLDPKILGSLIRSFRQGGVGFYYRPSISGGWIHADTGVSRTWKG